jgi:hypothetical protein
MLQISQVRDDLLSKLGIEDSTLATPLMLQDVVIAINGAMQMLQTAGQDFFTRQYLTVPLSAGTSFYTLPGAVQAVLGPIRWNNTKPLIALGSRGQLDQFDRMFLDSTNYGTSDAAEPVAYWVENVRNSSSSGDINQINIWLAPRPQSPSGFISVEVVNDAVAYLVGDLSSSVVLPVAQSYTESVFLPIARMLITRSSQFSRPDILAGLTTDYELAMKTLADAGGFPNAVQEAPPREVDA